MRLNHSALYRVRVIPGISGFQRWDDPETWIMRGDKVRTYATVHDVLGPYRASDSDRVEVVDGHLPENRPVLNGPDAAKRLRETGEQARLNP